MTDHPLRQPSVFCSVALSMGTRALLLRAFCAGTLAPAAQGAVASQGQASVPDVFHREELSGDWKGTRTAWKNKGVALASSLTQFYQGRRVWRNRDQQRVQRDGFGFFGQVSFADQATSPVTTFFDLGLGSNGLFAGRARGERIRTTVERTVITSALTPRRTSS